MNRKLVLNSKDRSATEDFRRQTARLLGDNLIQVILFGSKARGEDTKDSDIDVLVLVKNLTTDLKDRILDIAFDINIKHGVYLSPRVMALSAFNNPVWNVTPFIRNLKASGLPI